MTSQNGTAMPIVEYNGNLVLAAQNNYRGEFIVYETIIGGLQEIRGYVEADGSLSV
jgi:hypothetical protein